MNRAVPVVCLFALVAVTTPANDLVSSSNGETALASSACDRLSLSILSEAAAFRRNIVFSPFSLSGALGMAALGAKGETLAQIDRIAGTGIEPESLADRESGIRPSILAEARADGIELILADSLWKRKGDMPLPDFTKMLQHGFGAEILDFGPEPASSVNQWIAEKTKGLIPGAVNDLPSGTRLALVDAIYFKAQWAVPFDRKRTSDRAFHPEKGAPERVPFMNLLSFFHYDSSHRWESLEIPYQGEQFSMQIILPRQGETVAGLVNAWLSGAESPPEGAAVRKTNQWTHYLKLSIPKFSFGSVPDVIGAMRRLGATDAFDPRRGDFSGMFPHADGPLCISGFSHCAFIEVDERGTTASAATFIPFGCSAEMVPEEFIVDRPYLFFIREPGGRILFAGAVFHPVF